MRISSFLIVGFLVLAASTAHAGNYKIGSLDIADPYARATPKGAKVGAGYMKIINSGTTPDRLISGSSDVAEKLEIHEMAMDKGVMKMRPVRDGLEIKSGETIELKPGSFHVMFSGLKKQFSKGDHVKATLVFEKAGKVDVDFDVLAAGATPGHDMPGMKMRGH
jgi:copper(I)-binding protein